MATLPRSLMHEIAPSALSRTADRVSHMLAWIGERRARTAALRELERMDERDLRDLRISPYDFEDIARGTFRR